MRIYCSHGSYDLSSQPQAYTLGYAQLSREISSARKRLNDGVPGVHEVELTPLAAKNEKSSIAEFTRNGLFALDKSYKSATNGAALAVINEVARAMHLDDLASVVSGLMGPRGEYRSAKTFRVADHDGLFGSEYYLLLERKDGAFDALWIANQTAPDPGM